MRLYVMLALLTALVVHYIPATATSVTGCPDCDDPQCKTTTCSEGQVLKKYCNCCDACFNYVGEGEICGVFAPGDYIKSVCKSGFKCVKSKVISQLSCERE